MFNIISHIWLIKSKPQWYMIRFLVDMDKHATYMKQQFLEHIMFTRKNKQTILSLLMTVLCMRSLSAIGNEETASGKSFQHRFFKKC